MKRVAICVLILAGLVACGTEPSSPIDSNPGLASFAVTAGVVPSLMPASTGDTFYVATTGNDANPGTQVLPWKTIGKAFKALKPNQVALVAPGTYGARCSSMTYSDTAWTGQPKTIQAMGADTILGIFNLYGRGIRVSGFVFAGPTCGAWLGSTGQIGTNLIQMKTVTAYTELSNSEVFHGGWHAGVSEYGDHIYILNNWIHDNGNPLDTTQYNTSHGIYGHQTTNLVVQGNVLEHNRAKGLSARYNGGPAWILNNRVINNGRSGLDITDSTHLWYFGGNYIGYNGRVNNGYGINAGGSVGPNWIHGNTFQCNGTKGTSSYVLKAGVADSNTVLGC